MKSPLYHSYTQLSKIEKAGMLGLTILLLILISIRFFMDYFISQNLPKEDELKFKSAFRIETIDSNTNLIINNSAIASTPSLFNFDPNTIDSINLIKLGFKPFVAHSLINWRNHGKKFYNPDDLKSLYNLSAVDFNRLKPFIAIGISKPVYENHYSTKYPTTYSAPPPLPATINLNKADSALIVRLNGIGPTLAHKIIEKRKQLGGYYKIEQLLEIYKFPDTTFNKLKEKLTINSIDLLKIHLNSATEADLAAHPYIGEKVAKNILLLRNGLHHFSNIQELKQVPLMNEDLFRKIVPYLTIE